MKKSRIIAPALGVLILSTAASITGTVAWFTANNSVAVTGMIVKTKVGSNLLIADASTLNANDDVYGTELTQTKTNIYLEPVSTVNASSFFYHGSDGVHGDGSQSNNYFIQYTEDDRVGLTVADSSERPATPAVGDVIYQSDEQKYYECTAAKVEETPATWAEHTLDFGAEDKTLIDADFNNVYSFNHSNEENVCFGYVDYVFYLRAFSSAAGQALRMTDCNLLRSGAQLTNNDFAWRVGVLSAAVEEHAENPAGSMALKSILMHTSGSYFTLEDESNDPQAAATAYVPGNPATPGTLADVQELGTAPTIASNLEANSITRYKVVVRLWLEGEDESCNNETYAAFSADSWTLSVAFELGANPTGVQNILSVVA